jgi:P pilus assembly chaperone PapD
MFMLKNKLLNVVLITGIVSVILSGIAANSHAWKVTVKNDNDRPCVVQFYVADGAQ